MGGPSGRYFKICLIGDGFVGKTSIRRQYLGKTFKSNYIATLGVDFAQKTLQMDSGLVHLVIWDIAGQPLFKGLRQRYYDGCSGIILVYSVIDRESFDNASKWLVEAHGFMGPLPPLIVAANKIDLRASHPREETVSREEGEAFTEKTSKELRTQAVFIETSALTGENIDEAFEALTGMIMPEFKPKIPVSETKAPAPAAVSETPAVTSQAVKVIERPIEAPQGPQVEAAPNASDIEDAMTVKQEQIGREMADLVNLRTELRNAESDLNDIISKLDTALLNLTNVIQVKRIMYDHLKKQLQ
ncbi:GTP-binding protein, partial [Candidatus Thorarchaeota archaeon]